VSEHRPLPTPGVYRVAESDRATESLRAAGWDARRVEPARSTPELYRALAAALALPAWFGANLDALWDCLADLQRPTALVLTGWDGFADAEPGDALRFLDLFAERTRQDPAFVVVLAAD
jgi:RNAse (barnase) inhibitor barstar